MSIKLFHRTTIGDARRIVKALFGDAVLEVQLDVTEEAMATFELEGMLWDARVWLVPAEWATDHATVRIASVDPSTSGFFDQNTGEPEL
jgi:hypothetical protein